MENGKYKIENYSYVLAFLGSYILVHMYTCLPVHLFFIVQTLANSFRRSGWDRTQKCTSRAVTDIQPAVLIPKTALNSPVDFVKKLCVLRALCV